MLEGPPTAYRFLSCDDVGIANVDDVAELKNLITSMGIMGISDEEVHGKFGLRALKRNYGNNGRIIEAPLTSVQKPFLKYQNFC